MNLRHEHVTVSDLLEAEQYGKPVVGWNDQPALQWQLDPGGYTDAEAITVDITNTRRFLRIAGFASLALRHGTSEQEDAASNAVVTGFGIGADGSATAVGVGRRTAKPKLADSSVNKDTDEGIFFEDYQWPRIDLTLDRGAAGQQISDLIRGRQGLSREQAWATTVDTAIRQGVHQAAKNHLFPTGGFHHGLQAAVGAYWSWITAESLYAVGTAGDFDPIASFNLGMYGGFIALNAMVNRSLAGSTHFRRKRHSLSPFTAQPDRLVATWGFGLTHSFVSAKR